MTSSVRTSSTAEVQSLIDHATATRDAERAAEAAKQPGITTATPARVQVTLRDGSMTVESDRSTQVQVPGPAVPKGFVKLSNGMVTSIEAAEAAGLFDTAVEFNRADAQSFKKGSLPSASEAPTSNAAETTEDNTTLSGVSLEAKAQIQKADSSLNEATAAIGANAVQSMQTDVVNSGVLPTELPQGVTPEMVAAIADGYVAQANTILRDTGTNVDALMMMLNGSELKDARLAVYRGDDTTLKTLGGRALGRLRSLPDDPVLFKELTAGWSKEVQITRRGDVTWVETPHFKLPWGEAVTRGHIRF